MARAILVAVLAVDRFPNDFAARFLNVGDGDELDIRLGEERFEHLPAARADADAADDDLVAGRDGPIFAEDGGRDDGGHAGEQGGLLDEASAGGWGGHGWSGMR